MTNDLKALYATNPVKACELALRRTSKLETSDRMEAINSLLGMFGVEAIRGNRQNGYWCDTVATYCNTGESYQITVMCQRGEYSFNHSRFFVDTMGDFVERNEKKLGIM